MQAVRIWSVVTVLLLGSCTSASRGAHAPVDVPGRADRSADAAPPEMMVRLSEIQIDPRRVDEYTAILKEESAASVRLEPGVISIFPMFVRENPSAIRILEIYASRAAYESHIQSAHFQRYKTTTLPMVTSLKLIDMEMIDPATMPTIFAKTLGSR